MLAQGRVGREARNGNPQFWNHDPGNAEAGGIVGWGGLAIERCYNTGNVSSIRDAGGITGYGSPIIQDCYNVGDISSKAEAEREAAVGGIAGYIFNSASIKSSYNVGNVTTLSGDLGSIVGYIGYGSTVDGCYYLDNISSAAGANDGPLPASAKALGMDKLERQNSFEGFDFDNVWFIDAHANYKYPQLKNIPQSLHEHDYVLSQTIPATCTAEGQRIFTCICGDSYSEPVEKLPHTPITIVDQDATCTLTGSKHDECSICYADLGNVQSIPIKSHTAGEWETTHAATCTALGERVKKCTICSAVVETGAIPATVHTSGDWEIIKAATSTDSGEKVKKCIICNAILESESISATGGDVLKTDILPAGPLTFVRKKNYSVFADIDRAEPNLMWNSTNAKVLGINDDGRIQYRFAKVGRTTIEVFRNGQKIDSVDVVVKWQWWQWIIVILMFGWIYL